MRTGTPPLESSLVARELLIGGIAGFVGALGGGFLGYMSENVSGRGSECDGCDGILIGIAAGITVMVPIGVAVAGGSGDQEGSFVGGLLGSAVGAALGIAAIAADNDRGVYVFLAAPLVGATIGYNASRRYKPEAARIGFRPGIVPIEHGLGVSLIGGAF